ncbi:hypothetical protein [Dolichospermum phage Dfl-JY45]
MSTNDEKEAGPGPQGFARLTIGEDGSLYDPSNYVYWLPGDSHVRLDAWFSPEQLMWIARHMQARTPCQDVPPVDSVAASPPHPSM